MECIRKCAHSHAFTIREFKTIDQQAQVGRAKFRPGVGNCTQQRNGLMIIYALLKRAEVCNKRRALQKSVASTKRVNSCCSRSDELRTASCLDSCVWATCRYKSDMLPAQPNQSLIDGLACLHGVIAASAPIGCRELGRRVGLERTRANRLLGTWRHLGLLEQTPSAKYVPGAGIHVLAGMGLHASGLLRAAMPTLRHFWSTGWAASLGVRWQDRFCFLVHVRPDLPFEDGIGSHATSAAIRTSAGLALLATTTEAERQEWDLASQWAEHGDGRDLDTVFTDIRSQDFATRVYDHDIRSIGVVIPGTHAALAISRAGLTPSLRAKAVNSCQEHAYLISADLARAAQELRADDIATIPA